MKFSRRVPLNLFLLLFLGLAMASCGTASRKQLLETNESQVKIRSIQTRVFDTTDKDKTMRSVISTLQDLDFVIEKADQVVGIVTGSKFTRNTVLKMTVTVRSRGEKQILVRANAQYGLKAVEMPEPYQDFFTALGKSMFLTANQVD